jgi:hypothetical protein
MSDMEVRVVGVAEESVVEEAAGRAGTVLEGVDGRPVAGRHGQWWSAAVQAVTGIYSPEWAPDWMGDREALWRAVRRAERSGDGGRAAYVVMLEAPRALGTDAAIRAVVEFGVQYLVSEGVVFDAGVLRSDVGGVSGGPLMGWVMATARRVDRNAGAFGARASIWREDSDGEWLASAWRELVRDYQALVGVPDADSVVESV